MNLETIVENGIEKAKALGILLEKDMATAAKEAYPITQKIAAALQSESGIIVENLIPNGATYITELISAINAALPALKLVAGIGDTSSTNGLLQRLGSQLTSIFHGGKHPFTFYVQEFEFICFGINPPAPISIPTPEPASET